jgi:hypothetical protein
MSGAITPIPNTPLWRGAQLKQVKKLSYAHHSRHWIKSAAEATSLNKQNLYNGRDTSKILKSNYDKRLRHNLNSSPNTVSVIKSRRMGWAGHVARMGEGAGVYGVWLEDLGT